MREFVFIIVLLVSAIISISFHDPENCRNSCTQEIPENSEIHENSEIPETEITIIQRYSKEDIEYLAMNVFFETRMKSLKDAISTSHVVMNRVKSKKYPNTIKEVITQRKQFSWYGSKNLKSEIKNSLEQAAWQDSLEFAENFLKFYDRLTDTTNGSLHYHAHYVNPYWAKEMTVTLNAEQHVFLR